MRKYGKEDVVNAEVKNDHIAEVPGLYCDLCGKLILKGDYFPLTYNDPIINRSRNLATDNRPRKVGDIIPTMKLHSFANDVSIDICCDCENDILSKVQKYAPSKIDILTNTTTDAIVEMRGTIEAISEERNSFRDRLYDMRSVLDQRHDW